MGADTQGPLRLSSYLVLSEQLCTLSLRRGCPGCGARKQENCLPKWVHQEDGRQLSCLIGSAS
eukprot:1157118-Pelagomonas_calceolata.AAC.12